MRTTSLAEGEFYHIYNRGVDKRTVFTDQEDLNRFLQGMKEFNKKDPIGSIYENSFRKDPTSSSQLLEKEKEPLVRFVAYCLNPNHYHFILEQVSERGIEKFMHRIGTGYTKYFNNKNKRNGALFQGRFKSGLIDSNTYLLHLSAYVNLNDRAHQLGSSTSKLVRSQSSWEEYTEQPEHYKFCDTDIVLKQFKNPKEYQEFAESSLQSILERKKGLQEIEDFPRYLEVELPS